MKKIKIISDSSSDLLELDSVDFAAVPLKISTADREFTDDAFLGVEEMVNYLEKYKGRSTTSCPNISDWLSAFGDADEVYCTTITSKLSGSYNSACAAKSLYEKENPGKKVYVIDTLSTGPELKLITEKIAELTSKGLSGDEVCREIEKNRKKTGLFFMLKSMKNLANNGRVSHLTAKLAGIAGIHIVGRANDGVLDPTNKCRGESRALDTIVDNLKKAGFTSGKIRISHSFNESAALDLGTMIYSHFKNADVNIYKCRGLCSFYAERGGLLVGFEKS